jgi:hypothetical protein
VLVPVACADCVAVGVDAAAACALDDGVADEVAADASEELLELFDEQPATEIPAARTQNVTAVDVRYRMNFLRGRR